MQKWVHQERAAADAIGKYCLYEIFPGAESKKREEVFAKKKVNMLENTCNLKMWAEKKRVFPVG